MRPSASLGAELALLAICGLYFARAGAVHVLVYGSTPGAIMSAVGASRTLKSMSLDDPNQSVMHPQHALQPSVESRGIDRASKLIRFAVYRVFNVTLVDPSPRLGGMCSGGLGSSDIGDPSVIG